MSSTARTDGEQTPARKTSGKSESFDKIMDRILDSKDRKATDERLNTGSQTVKGGNSKDQKAAPDNGGAREQASLDEETSLEVAVAGAVEMVAETESTGSAAEIEPQAGTETASSSILEQVVSSPALLVQVLNTDGGEDEQVESGTSDSGTSATGNAGPEVEQAGSHPGESVTTAEPKAEAGDIVPADTRPVSGEVQIEAPRQEDVVEQALAPGSVPELRPENSAQSKPADGGRTWTESGELEQARQAMEPAQDISLPKHLESLKSLELAARAQAQGDDTEATLVSSESGQATAPSEENPVRPVMSLLADDQAATTRAASEMTPSAPRIVEVEPTQGRASNNTPVSDVPQQAELPSELADADGRRQSEGQARNDNRESFAERFAAGIQENRFAARADSNPAATLVKGPDGDFVPTVGTAPAPEAAQPPFEQMLMRAERLQEVIQRFDEHVLDLTSGKGTSMTISLDPPNLGKLVLSCKESGENISIQIVASSSQAREFLAAREGVIREILANRGRELAEFNVRTEDDNPGQRQFTRERTNEDDEPTGRLADIAEPTRTGEHIETKQEDRQAAEGIWYVA